MDLLAHSILHGQPENGVENDGSKKDRRTKEVEAESVAFTVCNHFGVDTSKGVKKNDYDQLQEDAANRAAIDIENAIAEKKPSVLE